MRLRQVLFNLLGNAIKFTHEGEIVLNVSLQRRDREGAVLLFRVRDTGIGIAADKLSLVFEAFEQGDASTTRRYGGTGLGLAICSRLVALMGGRLWAESELGRGSVFSFTARFDPAEEAAAGREPLQTIDPTRRAGGRRQRHQPLHPSRDARRLADGAPRRRQRARSPGGDAGAGRRRAAVPPGDHRRSHAGRRRLRAGRRRPRRHASPRRPHYHAHFRREPPGLRAVRAAGDCGDVAQAGRRARS